MKLTSKIYWFFAQRYKRNNQKQYAIVAASLYGINEVYGIRVTFPLVLDMFIDIFQSKFRRKQQHGKKQS